MGIRKQTKDEGRQELCLLERNTGPPLTGAILGTLRRNCLRALQEQGHGAGEVLKRTVCAVATQKILCPYGCKY